MDKELFIQSLGVSGAWNSLSVIRDSFNKFSHTDKVYIIKRISTEWSKAILGVDTELEVFIFVKEDKQKAIQEYLKKAKIFMVNI